MKKTRAWEPVSIAIIMAIIALGTLIFDIICFALLWNKPTEPKASGDLTYSFSSTGFDSQAQTFGASAGNIQYGVIQTKGPKTTYSFSYKRSDRTIYTRTKDGALTVEKNEKYGLFDMTKCSTPQSWDFKVERNSSFDKNLELSVNWGVY